MKTYHCPNCNRNLEFAIPQAFSGHIRSCRKNGNRPLAAKSAPPVSVHDPLAHLDSAITEIDARSAEIRTELQGKAVLETELDRLQIQREYIIAAKTQISKRTQPQPAESMEAAHEHAY